MMEFKFKPGQNPLDNLNRPEWQERKQRMLERVFHLRDTAISSRQFNQWKNAGLIDLPITPNGREWIKLNFVDFVWLKLLHDLRGFGCSVNDILRVRKICFLRPLQDTLHFLPEKVLEKMMPQAIEQMPGWTDEQKQQAKKELQEMLTSLEYKNKTLQTPSLLELTIMNMVMTGENASLFLYIDYKNEFFPKYIEGQTKIARKKWQRQESRLIPFFYSTMFEKVELPEGQVVDYRNLPHMELPLRTYLQQFITEPRNHKFLDKTGLLSKEEIILIEEVRKKRASEITVHFKDGSIERIDATTDLQKDPETRIIETYMRHDYADITYKIENGKIVSFKKTIKIKPNKE